MRAAVSGGAACVADRQQTEGVLELDELAGDILGALAAVDASGEPFRGFRAGVGPYGEPQLVKRIADHLRGLPGYGAEVRTKRVPDLLIAGRWAVEFKITRPFGDNGREAENWSVNLLHPYPGNVSSIGDCLKLRQLDGPERRAVAVIGYEHQPAVVDLAPLVLAFECIARDVAGIRLSPRIELRQDGLVHPVHQSVRLFVWEVLAI